MDKFEKGIGKNIRDIRLERGLSQEALADKCEFSNTTLSAYENSRKIPNLKTISRIAKQLNVSIERLYYGDENNSFINSEPDDGKKIVNSIYLLWSLGVINYYENYISGISLSKYNYEDIENPRGCFLNITKHTTPIKRFIKSLNEFKHNKSTYPEPEKYLDILKSSIATEINNQIQQEE